MVNVIKHAEGDSEQKLRKLRPDYFTQDICGTEYDLMSLYHTTLLEPTLMIQEQDFIDYLERFELNPKQKINTLSKGMRMKYALALALSHKAELLIMDEPTSGLDPLVRGQLLKILTEYMENGGKGVFFSTHITSDLDKIADMLIMIDNGRIVFREEKDTLLDTYRIVKGDRGALTADTRKLFLSISETDFGFTGITKQISEVRSYIPNIMVERPTIEDIMLGNIGGEK